MPEGLKKERYEEMTDEEIALLARDGDDERTGMPRRDACGNLHAQRRPDARASPPGDRLRARGWACTVIGTGPHFFTVAFDRTGARECYAYHAILQKS